MLLLISFSVIPALLALYLCSFLPHILQFYQQEWSVRMETGRKYPQGQHVIVKEKESWCFIKSSTAWSAGDKCFSLTALWNPGVPHPAWSHGVQLNWDSYGVDCQHKSTFEENCLNNLPSEGRCLQDKCFLQPQLPSKVSQRLPYQIYQTLLGKCQNISDLLVPTGRTGSTGRDSGRACLDLVMLFPKQPWEML